MTTKKIMKTCREVIVALTDKHIASWNEFYEDGQSVDQAFDELRETCFRLAERHKLTFGDVEELANIARKEWLWEWRSSLFGSSFREPQEWLKALCDKRLDEDLTAEYRERFGPKPTPRTTPAIQIKPDHKYVIGKAVPHD